tara:strand:+ start:87 stop:500 length:414 start_codon:yes stop_codon:yes gene_type:complete
MKICIIVSEFYPEISKMLINGAVKKLTKNNVKKYKIIRIPGTLEIPTLISALINKYDGFVVLGCVIKGKTPHFNYLCNSVFNSLTSLSIKYKKPLGNGILTCNNKRQAIERADYRKKDKGGNAVQAMITVLKIVKNV